MEDFIEVCETYGKRMRRKEKGVFRDYLFDKARLYGYDSHLEKSLLAKNVVVGDIAKAEIVFTAHYDTPPRLPKFFVKHLMLWSLIILCGGSLFLSKLPEIVFNFIPSYDLFIALNYFAIGAIGLGSGAFLLHTMGFLGNANKTNYNDNSSGVITLLKLMAKYKDLSKPEKDKIAFVFFDNEEKLLLGSLTHKYKNLKKYKEKTYINFDCVGLGNQVNLFHFGKERQIGQELKTQFEKHSSLSPKSKGSTIFSMSDHFPFRKTNHVCLLTVDKENEKSLYSQIHSKNDNKIDYSNLNNIVNAVSNLDFLKELEAKSKERFSFLQKPNIYSPIMTNFAQINKEKIKYNEKEY